ncbi:MAG: GNAT family N-acetyltransferase [Actinomycetota bacterium]
MDLVAPLVRLIIALDELLEHADREPWGAVVTDSRLPSIYDANYARVDGHVDVTLREVETSLLPALKRSGARTVHVVTFDPPATPALVADLEREAAEVTIDSMMRVGTLRRPSSSHDVREAPHGPGLWASLRVTLPEFDLKDERVIEELIWWQREVLAPAGKRWFTVELEDGTAGIGSLFVHEDAAYVDDVVTMPWARRRGVASAIVAHMVAVAGEEGVEHVYLLADEPGPIAIYERLGFEAIGEVIGGLRPLR